MRCDVRRICIFRGTKLQKKGVLSAFFAQIMYVCAVIFGFCRFLYQKKSKCLAIWVGFLNFASLYIRRAERRKSSASGSFDRTMRRKIQVYAAQNASYAVQNTSYAAQNTGLCGTKCILYGTKYRFVRCKILDYKAHIILFLTNIINLTTIHYET